MSSLWNLFKCPLAVGLLALANSQAATVTVTAGLSGQGFTPAWDGSGPIANFTISVGTWNAGTQTFTPFASIVDTGEINGSFTATGPASFNNQEIAVFVGSGASVAESGSSWVVLTHASHPLFPPDVSAPSGVTFAATTPAVVTIAGSGSPGWYFEQTATGYNLVPEPTSVLIGVLGLAGLLRRRR
jgi:hypothetical protein